MSETYLFHGYTLSSFNPSMFPELFPITPNQEFWNHLLVMEPSSDHIHRYQAQYSLIETHFLPHRPPFSPNDFQLAFIASETGTTVISQDRHLQKQIHHYLEYECILPAQLDHYPNAEMYLLDANIVIPLINLDSDSPPIQKMVVKAAQKTFLLPNFILDEVKKHTLPMMANPNLSSEYRNSQWLVASRYRSVFRDNYD